MFVQNNDKICTKSFPSLTNTKTKMCMLILHKSLIFGTWDPFSPITVIFTSYCSFTFVCFKWINIKKVE